jgi:hypothetical protein
MYCINNEEYKLLVYHYNMIINSIICQFDHGYQFSFIFLYHNIFGFGTNSGIIFHGYCYGYRHLQPQPRYLSENMK